MKFKIDENLPVETTAIFQQAGHDAETFHLENLTGTDDQRLSAVCRNENRILITLDIGFADIRTYPPNEFPGFIIIRSKRQDKPYILGVIQKIIPSIENEKLKGKLWIVEAGRVRERGE